MKRTELNRRVLMWPAQILDYLADEQTWADDGATVSILSNRVEGLRMTVSLPVPGNQIPAPAQRFMGADARVVQHIRADPVRETAVVANLQIDAEIPGAPIDVRVDISLSRKQDDYTDLRALIETSCSLPFVGSAIESGALPQVEAMISRGFDKFSVP